MAMTQKDFVAIEQYDVIEIRGKNGETRIGPVLKDSDNRILVAGIYKTIFGREKGFYQTVGPKDVDRVVKTFSADGQRANGATIKSDIERAREILKEAREMI